jgi:hypothetical protein
MYFLIGLLIFTTLIIGVNFCFLLIGGTPFHKGEEFAPVHLGRRTYTVERFAVGVSTATFGLAWLVAWAYFLVTGWESFMSQFSSLIIHVVLQFLAAVGLLIAGIGIFRQNKHSTGIFSISMVLLVGSLFVAIVFYGPRGHGEPVFMYLFGFWTLVVGGFFTTVVFLLEKLLKTNGRNP